MGPLLFLIFINDLPDNLNCKTRLFADDCIVYNTIKDANSAKLLQDDLDSLATWEKTWGMEFHPQKCSVLSVTRSRSPFNFRYKLKGHTLESTDSSKYLGINLSSNLTWKLHIDKMTKKANSVLGFLRRNLHHASSETKANAYITLVRPHLEYCSTVWNPYHQDDIYKIEMVQRRAARFATNRYHNTSSVTSMLHDLGWYTLERRRNHQQLIFLYKIINGHVEIEPSNYLTPSYSKTRANHSQKFMHISASKDYYKNSFFPRTIPSWNSLPQNVAEASTLLKFKKELSTFASFNKI